MSNIHNSSVDKVFNELGSLKEGLREEEVKRRLQTHGYNRIEEVRKKNLLKAFLSKFTHLFAILLWIAFFLCLLSEYLHPGGGLLSLGIAILIVIFINAIFSFFQEYKAEKTIQALKKLLPLVIRVTRGGVVKEVPSDEVVPGDILILREGDKVSADARITESTNLMVNDALLTGESKSKVKYHKEYPGDFHRSPNLVFAGSFIERGVGKAVVFATGMNTELGKIAHLTKEVPDRPSPLLKEISRLSRVIALIAISIGIFFFLIGFFIGEGFWKNFLFAIGIIIALVPEGLLPTVSLSLAIGSSRMAKKNALIKNLLSVEALGSVTVICTDKTGTLTQNKMEVEKVWTFSNGITDKEGNNSIPSYSQLRISSLSKIAAKHDGLDKLMIIAKFCNNAFLCKGQYQGDSTDVALMKVSEEMTKNIEASRLLEIPFDSLRKRMSTVNKIDGKTLLLSKGAVESVLPLCNRFLKDGEIRLFSEAERKHVLETFYSLMDEGYRILSFAYKEVDFEEKADDEWLKKAEDNLESELIFVGLMGIEDAPRPKVPEAIKKCYEAGIRVIMITGDAGRTALSIARQVGMVKNSPKVIEGPELEKMTEAELKEKLAIDEIIFARMTPAHKMRIVSTLEKLGERVAVTGDGVNDAPALKQAHLGVAMGFTGTDVAREAADMILLDDNFASIVNAIEEGRTIFENIRKFITYIFASNISELIPFAVSVIFGIPLPLTIMQILAIDLGTDMVPAIALGAEKPMAGIMQKPPRSPKERLLNGKILCRAYLFLGLIEASAGLFGFFYVMKLGGWEWGSNLIPNEHIYIQATSACLAGIIISQIGNVFACRSPTESICTLGFFSNKLVLFGIVCEVIYAAFVLFSPIGNFIFKTAPLSFDVILVLLPFSVGILLAEELRKSVFRRF